MGQVNVTISGKTYRMACDDGQEEHLTALGRAAQRHHRTAARPVRRDRRPAPDGDGGDHHGRPVLRDREAIAPGRGSIWPGSRKPGLPSSSASRPAEVGPGRVDRNPRRAARGDCRPAERRRSRRRRRLTFVLPRLWRGTSTRSICVCGEAAGRGRRTRIPGALSILTGAVPVLARGPRTRRPPTL